MSTAFDSRKRWETTLLDESADALDIHPVRQEEGGGAQLLAQPPHVQRWAATVDFKAAPGEVLLVPTPEGDVGRVLLGLGLSPGLWAYAALPSKLPPAAACRLPPLDGPDADQALLGWALGSYKFTRYKTPKPPAAAADAAPAVGAGDAATAATAPRAGAAAPRARLVVPASANRQAVSALAEAFFWARDCITTPAEDMGPQQLAAEATALAAQHPGARVEVTEGEALLSARYPAIHTVGRAAARPPVLIDLNWAPEGLSEAAAAGLPLVCLVGKGVCFDSGGLDIKTAAGMLMMKKDMGGAALVLALAHVVMAAQLPVRLRVLVPAVENAISGNAYRPGDVLSTRASITVENGNTDAEGRLVLCDALAEAAAHAPDLIIDAATLTGAARVALGPELPAVFCSDDGVWAELEAASKAAADPLWRLPLHAGYRRMLDSKVADIRSTPSEAGQAGAITAALFLAEFVKACPRWVHIDTAAWVSGGGAGAGRPEGGEALALRALWGFLQARYA